MATKIPFRIYKLKSFDDPDLNKYPIMDVGPWQYIQGKTEDDIYSGQVPEDEKTKGAIGHISLDPSNFVTPVDKEKLRLPFLVYEDKTLHFNLGGQPATETFTGRLKVLIDNTPYYIIRTQLPENSVDPVPDIFEFYVNPQRIQFDKQKLITEVRTRGGWDIQHWGEKLTTITVDGITGGLHRDRSRTESPGDYGQSLAPGEAITESTAWKRLRILRAIYDADYSDTSSQQYTHKLGFSIFEDFYIGYFQSFNGPEIVADKPYLMTFSFVFKVEQKLTEIPLKLDLSREQGFNPNVPTGG